MHSEPAHPNGAILLSQQGPAEADSPKSLLPEVTIELVDPEGNTRTRRGVIHTKRMLAEQRGLAFDEIKGMPACAEKNRLYRAIQDCTAEVNQLEQHLQENFIPQHGPSQFLSPRAFFVSPLFCVRSKSIAREQHIELALPTAHGKPIIKYKGPELRQTDGLVFLALLHMARDVQLGTAVSLQPKAVCEALFGGYDGHTRKLLSEHIQRLQHGLVVFEHFSVQLCLRFDYPRVGPWTVGLDTKIIELFRASPEAWLRMKPRLSLPDGLATWLFAFIESQSKLIPMSLGGLRKMCGSNATDKAFLNRFRDAMRHLTHAEIIDKGWSLKKGTVRWMKARSQ